MKIGILALGITGAILAVGSAFAASGQALKGHTLPYVAKGEFVLYISPMGQDSWSGNTSTANPKGTDGPLATLKGARDRIRELKGMGKVERPIHVFVNPGTYRLKETFTLYPEDSGTKGFPITYEGVLGDSGLPVISGGLPIKGWKPKGGAFVAEVPEIRDGLRFSSIWVDGERRDRCRMPDNGFYSVADKVGDDGKDAFRYMPGDIKEWPDSGQAVVSVFHQWENSYHRISGVDDSQSRVDLINSAPWPFWSRQRYRVENVRAALDSPGEWYADETAGTLEYIPRAGENPEKSTSFIPVVETLVSFNGNPESGSFVENIHIKGLRFKHTGYPEASTGHADWQAANTVSAAIEVIGARDCSLRRSEISATENHGIWIRRGSKGFRLEHNEIKDFGAGGVRIGEASTPSSSDESCSSNVVDNNLIHDGTRIFHGGCGIWVGLSSGNRITHNEISDLDYTGISVGWVWGYAESQANKNKIEYNHIHHLGRGLMSDMGGIYTLGISPGTTERYNLIHDIHCYEGGYGGWGIYTDEGSSGILIENNLVYDTTSSGFHQHYGEGNTVRNNIFAFGRDGQVQRTRMEPHISFNFEGNIVVGNDQPMLIGNWSDNKYMMTKNLYWDYSGNTPNFNGLGLEKWQTQSKDRDAGSIIADPRFGDPLKDDFTLLPDSPALSLGFKPFDTSKAGLYGEPDWTALPAGIIRQEYAPAPPKARLPISEGFEDTLPGLTAFGPTTAEDGGGNGTARVTEGTAAEGKRSLMFHEEPGVRNSWDPHVYYNTDFNKGVIVGSFWLKVAKGTPMYHEWRDGSTPYKIGPSLEVNTGGKLKASGKFIADLPPDTWVKLTMECGLGDQSTGKYGVTLEIPGQPPTTLTTSFPKGFNRLNWIGWVSSGTGNGTFYIDSVTLKPKATAASN